MAESFWKILGWLSSITGKNQEVAFRDIFTWKITTLVQVESYTFNICLLKAIHNIKINHVLLLSSQEHKNDEGELKTEKFKKVTQLLLVVLG